MPYTPYHVGPSGFFGLLLRRWVDLPVFVLVNVLIDIEVLADRYFSPGWPVHQLWHFHTLLVGGMAGAVFGAILYWIRPFRWCSEKSMALIGLPQKAQLRPMIAGGLLGAWLHVLIDSFYHYDVQIFWPYAKNPFHLWMRKAYRFNQGKLHHDIELVCLVFWGLLIGLYAILIFKKLINVWKAKA